MTAYLLIIAILLLAFAIYESYRYYIFKYKSEYVSALIKSIDSYEVFQRPFTKAMAGEKKAIQVTMQYEVNNKQYTKKEKISEKLFDGNIGEQIQLLILKNQPGQCSLKPHFVCLRSMIFAIVALIIWSMVSVLVYTL